MLAFSKIKAFICLLLVTLFFGGCAVPPPKVDPYSTLLPEGMQIVERTIPLSFANLKNETVYLVAGANFINYADTWTRNHNSQGFRRLLDSQQKIDVLDEDWSPMKITSAVVTNLRKNFKEVVVVNDLAEAMDKKAQWIVMFDHLFEWHPPAATWTNTTTIDLLDSKLKRAANTTFSEYKSYGFANSKDDRMLFSKYKGEDVVHSVNSALKQFAIKLGAS